jgi:hypothetical protein
LFPWLNQSGPDLDFLDDEEEHTWNTSASHESLLSVGNGLKDLHNMPTRSRYKDDDELSSTGSDLFGERLSDRGRQAVLVYRLRSSQPDPIAANTNTPEQPPTKTKGKGLLNGITIPTANNSGRPKRILQQSSTSSNNHNEIDHPTSQKSLNGTTGSSL